ncbi:heterokaryon incompatibility protein-domain-containing protein [Podospora didyma]|uniref:Heterokaryon incompatibility protein-domain-containing protein n=1 Tax=Podospora didyma TaxID=330526 RepID=A0AAE0TW75_9PEZI|nr:heterokaryon incompatibility protein-domain-containing protein [Podospora didyma]
MKYCSWCTERDWRSLGYFAPRSPAASVKLDDEWNEVEDREAGTRDKDGPGTPLVEDLTINDSKENEDERELVDLSHEQEGCEDSDPNDKYDDDDYDSDPDALGENERLLLETLESAATCHLCQLVATTFTTWATRHFGSVDRIDMSKAKMLVRGISVYRLGQGMPNDEDYADAVAEEDAGDLFHTKIGITVIHPDTGVWEGPDITFRKSMATPPTVKDMLVDSGGYPLLHWPPETEPYTARARPLLADLRLLQAWDCLCSSSHGDKCRQTKHVHERHRPHMIRLIDVERNCLVEVYDQTVTWVALSYVWGTKRFRTLQKDSLSHFQQPGALRAEWVPDTISDAIEVTRSIGQKFLWTDSLCIIQDSPEDVMGFIPCMGAIYGLSSVTIINAAGDNAFSGLPGVRPDTRSEVQEVLQVEGARRMMKSLDELSAGETVGFTYGWITASKWFTRGWTFQEAILSERWIMFTPENIYWECKKATWREDACWEVEASPDAATTTLFYDPSFYDPIFQDLWKTSGFDRAYRYLVESYSSRLLTYGGDGLNAFEGVLNMFRATSGIGFFWGLPRPYLGVALTWPSDHKCKRRQGKASIQLGDGSIITVEFPTWAWAAWETNVLLVQRFGYLNAEHAGLEYYSISEAMEVVHIPQTTEMRLREGNTYHTHTRAEPMWRGDTLAKVGITDIPASLRTLEGRAGLLVFWTSCAKLEVDYEDQNSIWYNGMKLEVSWDQEPEISAGQQRLSEEFVVVGRHSLERGWDRSALSVLLTEKQASGARTRRGLANIPEEEWNRLKNRRWELVSLT